MTRLGIPVPPGFTLTTEVCADFFAAGERSPRGSTPRCAMLERVGAPVDARFGERERSLLVSVRSGARASMPWDDGHHPEPRPERRGGRGPRQARGIAPLRPRRLPPPDAELERRLPGSKLDEEILVRLGAGQKEIVLKETGSPFPEDSFEQLRGAVAAVFSSWRNPRARIYRAMHETPEAWGTACSVQTMVFGNLGDASGTGIAFTRDPSTGERRFFGAWLPNARSRDGGVGLADSTADDLDPAASRTDGVPRGASGRPGETRAGSRALRTDGPQRRALGTARERRALRDVLPHAMGRPPAPHPRHRCPAISQVRRKKCVSWPPSRTRRRSAPSAYHLGVGAEPLPRARARDPTRQASFGEGAA